MKYLFKKLPSLRLVLRVLIFNFVIASVFGLNLFFILGVSSSLATKNFPLVNETQAFSEPFVKSAKADTINLANFCDSSGHAFIQYNTPPTVDQTLDIPSSEGFGCGGTYEYRDPWNGSTSCYATNFNTGNPTATASYTIVTSPGNVNTGLSGTITLTRTQVGSYTYTPVPGNCPAGLTMWHYSWSINVDVSSLPNGQYGLRITASPSCNTSLPSGSCSYILLTGGSFTVSHTPTFTCTASPNPVSINPGDSTAFTITTSPSAGFSSPVTFTSSINPNTGTPPSVSIDPATNGRTPPATTTANVSSTASTTAGTYSITFTGTGGGETAQCSVQLTVNPAGRNFNLVIQPGTSTTGNPNATIVGNNYNFTVFAECTGGFTGPVSNLVASTAFAGAVITFTNSGYPPPDNNRLAQLNCGATTPLVVSTSSIGAEQQSTPQNFLLRDITVTGEGQL